MRSTSTRSHRDHRDRRVEHRRHRHADRRPAQHHHRWRHPGSRSAHLSPISRRSRPSRSWSLRTPLRRLPLAAPDRPQARRRVMDLDASASIEDRDEPLPTVPVSCSRSSSSSSTGAPPRGCHCRARRRHRDAPYKPPVARRCGQHRLAAVLLPRPVRDGRRARRDRRHRRSPTGRGLTGGDRTAELLGITWVSALGSGLVDNIPFTATMIG